MKARHPLILVPAQQRWGIVVLIVLLVTGMAGRRPSEAPIAQLIDIKSTVTPARATVVWVNGSRVSETDPLDLDEGTYVKTGPDTQAVIAYFDNTAENPTVKMGPNSSSTVKKESFFIHQGFSYIKGAFNSLFNVESSSVKVGMTGTSFVLAVTPMQEEPGPPRYRELQKLLARIGLLDAEMANSQNTTLVVVEGTVAVSPQAGATIEASAYRVGDKVHFEGADHQEQSVLSEVDLARVRTAAENGTLTVDEQGTLADGDAVILGDTYGKKWLRFVNSNRDLAEALVGYWPLDEKEGSQIIDLTGYGTRHFNNGTPTLAIGEAGGPQAVDGMISGALEFSGNIARITIPHHASMKVGIGNYTVSAWVKIKKIKIHLP